MPQRDRLGSGWAEQMAGPRGAWPALCPGIATQGSASTGVKDGLEGPEGTELPSLRAHGCGSGSVWRARAAPWGQDMPVAGSSVMGGGGPGPLTCADLLSIRDLEGEEGGGGGGAVHLFHLLRGVQHGPDDHDSVQKVERDAVRRGDVLRAPARPTSSTSLRPLWTVETWLRPR